MNIKLTLALLFFSQLIFSQQNIVSGIIKDSIGEIIIGANVIVEGTNRHTNTDLDGKYSIKANPNNFLVFSFTGKKNRRIIADKNVINVQLLESEPIKGEHKPAYYPKLKKSNPATIVTKKDIQNIDNPKYNFNKNAKNNVFVIFLSELTSYDFNKEDLEFQQKYNVKYSLTGDLKINYLIKYNELTFKHLKEKYNRTWQAEIRKDAVGLEKQLK